MQRGKFRFCIDRAKFCRVGDIDHARQNHMLVLSVAVAAHDLAHKRRRQLTVGASMAQTLWPEASIAPVS